MSIDKRKETSDMYKTHILRENSLRINPFILRMHEYSLPPVSKKEATIRTKMIKLSKRNAWRRIIFKILLLFIVPIVLILLCFLSAKLFGQYSPFVGIPIGLFGILLFTWLWDLIDDIFETNVDYLIMFKK